MKIAYIGNFGPEYSTENDVRKAFEHLGHEVIQIQENHINPLRFAMLHEIVLGSDLLLHTGTWDDIIPLEAWLDLFHECALKGVPTATLHLDTFWGTSRGGRRWWTEPMFHTAYIFTADGDWQKQWKLFGKNHIWLEPAVRHDAVHKGKFRREYECDLAFVGSNGQGYHEDVWSYRKELVDFLRSLARRHNWEFKNPGGDDPKISRGEDMNDFYASAKVTVGDSLCLLKEKSQYWSDRVPEATGRGGFLIMPKIDVIYEDPNYYGLIPMYDWNNFVDLEGMIKHFLADEAGRKDIVEKNIKIVEKNHTYVNRAQTILDTIFQ